MKVSISMPRRCHMKLKCQKFFTSTADYRGKLWIELTCWINTVGKNISARMTSAGRAEAGMGARGCRGASLLGVFGGAGVYNELVATHLTHMARRTHFKGERGQWFVLAQDRGKWRAFVNSVKA